jgi:hypothetical protein
MRGGDYVISRAVDRVRVIVATCLPVADDQHETSNGVSLAAEGAI